MPAKFEEVVINAHVGNAEDPGEQGAQPGLQHRPRRPPPSPPRVLRRWQRTAVQLPVGGQRQRIQIHDRRGHHMIGQPAPQKRHQVHTLIRAHHIPGQPPVPRPVLTHQHRRMADPRHLPQHPLNLPRLDPEPPHLHLIIHPADELQHPRAVPPPHIPRPVHPSTSSPERAGHEPLRGQIRPPPIPPRQTSPSHINLPRHPRRHQTQPLIQHIHPLPAHRPPHRHTPTTSHLNRIPGRNHRRLGRPIRIRHPHPRPGRQHLRHPRRRHHITARPHQIHPRQIPRRLLRQHIEQRRREHRRTHTLLPDHPPQLRHIHRIRRPHHHRPTPQQRDKQLIHRRIKRMRTMQQHPPPVPHPPAPVSGKRHHTGLRYRHPLRHPRRPRREHDVCHLQRRHRNQWHHRPLTPTVLIVRSQDGQPVGDPLHRLATVGNGDPGTDQFNRPPFQRGRERIRQRHITPTSLQDGQNSGHHPGRPLHHHHHRRLRPHPRSHQPARQPRHPLIQLRIRPAHPPTTHRHRTRAQPHLPAEQPRNRGRDHPRPARRPTISHPGQPPPQLTAKHIDRTHRLPAITSDPSQQPLPAADHQFHRFPVKQLPRILHHPRQATTLLSQRERQIKLRPTSLPFKPELLLHPLTRQLEPGSHIILQNKHRLEQRMTIRRPHRINRLHHPLKRHILILQRSQIPIPHPPHQLPKPRIPRHIRPQHQRVHKKPDQILQHHITPPSHHHPQRHIHPRTQPPQQRRKPSLQNHEQRPPAPPRHPAQTRHHIHTNPEPHKPRHPLRPRHPRPVHRQPHLLRQPRQNLPPKTQLPRNHTPRIILIPQQLPLPQHIIRILHRQRRPPRHPTRNPRPICHRQIPRQRPQRPPITRNMMNNHRQHMLHLRQPQQLRPHRRPAAKIKIPRRNAGQCRWQPSPGHIGDRNIQPHLTGIQHPLPRAATRGRVNRPQHLMPA